MLPESVPISTPLAATAAVVVAEVAVNGKVFVVVATADIVSVVFVVRGAI